MIIGESLPRRFLWRRWFLAGCGALLAFARPAATATPAAERVDFNREVRRILSDNCFKCHGPDAKERKGGKDGLRLDTPEGASADLGGYRAIVPGHPEQSELVRRISTDDPDDKMPPPQSGKKLTAPQIAILKQWVAQGAEYARHWAYLKPRRPGLPEVGDRSWPHNAIDYFILARLEREALKPAPEADRYALIRRVSLDLTGLPPTLEEVDEFVSDQGPNAYSRLVDRLLAKPAFGEHWARWWLDEARYADSAGYADDPPRTIWAYRDYVIRSFNANKPFDQFTLEQLAGDLLPDATEAQRIATAFHRNTMTNNEGGTSDEEFRNVAVVDRVNTTMAVWMGTTMACAQCHDHKYDPLKQKEYFRLFAILNNTEDSDKSDESPVLALYSAEQKQQQQQWRAQIAKLEQTLKTPTPELREAEAAWESGLTKDLDWRVFKPDQMEFKTGTALNEDKDGAIHVERAGKADRYSIEGGLVDRAPITGLRLEVQAIEPGSGAGNASPKPVVVRLGATVGPPGASRVSARYLRLEIPGQDKILSLAEVQVFSGGTNAALGGQAKQSSTAYDGRAELAIDGNTNGNYFEAKSTTHTEISNHPWWELDLKRARPIDRIVVWNRTDGNLQSRLSHFQVSLLNEKREPVWQQTVDTAPNPSAQFAVSTVRDLAFAAAYTDANGADSLERLEARGLREKGWTVAGAPGRWRRLTVIPSAPAEAALGSRLQLALEVPSGGEDAALGKLRVYTTTDARAAEFARIPSGILSLVKTPRAQRTQAQGEEISGYYLSIAPGLQPEREQLAKLQKQFKELKPSTTVPVMRELAGEQRRHTHIQHRGNYLDVGEQVSEGLPGAFQAPPKNVPLNRLALARWLVDENNPLTARVIANRFWESIFGIGIVRTSEDFGTQGEAPSHPELLDWLATELMQQHWNIKHLLKLMVTSAAYCQSSRVTPEWLARDQDNRLVARGPRFRLSAEMVRDQALLVSGLLSRKMYGPPVKPPQPKLGLSAAFGSGIDWETSNGEDRYRRALYTMWRRSNPYPSMATFDAPSREVCLVRRERSNTPLQALVTLNDPVYVEAAEALARRMAAGGTTPADKVRHGFRLCLARPAAEAELRGLLQLYGKAYARFAGNTDQARTVSTRPAGASPPGSDVAELAAWTVVGNVLLNLDEMLMKR